MLPEVLEVFQHNNERVYGKDGRARCHELGEGLSHEADADHKTYELDVKKNSRATEY